MGQKRRRRGGPCAWACAVAVLLTVAAQVVDATAAEAEAEDESTWTLAERGAKYRRRAMFREAAEAYDQYVAGSHKESDSFRGDVAEALAEAARLWIALDESARAARDVEQFEGRLLAEPDRGPSLWIRRDWERPDPTEVLAAELWLELGAHYAERKSLVTQAAHWERTLRSPFVSRSLGHRLRAESKLAQVRWQQSCPLPQQDGLCVRWQRYRPPPGGQPMCEPWSQLEQPHVRPRNVRLAEAALQGARRVLSSYPVPLILAQRRGGEPSAHLGDAGVVAAVEEAFRLQADERFERFLVLAVPPKGVRPDGKPTAEYRRWFDARLRPLNQARDAYRDLFDLSDGFAGQAAAARLLQAEVFAIAGLWWMPIPPVPKNFAPPGLSRRDIETLFAEGSCHEPEPYHTFHPLLEDFVTCLERAQRLGVSSPWLAQCERMAFTIRPSEWPIPSEIYGSEFASPTPLDRADIVTAAKGKR